jgi:hypothetical protein
LTAFGALADEDQEAPMTLRSQPLLLATLVVAMSTAGLARQADAQPANADPVVFDATQVARLLERPATGRFEAVQDSGTPTRKRDSLWNGVIIGASAGALLGLIPDYYDDCEECHDSLYISIAVGAGIGLVVDLLRSGGPPASPSRSQGGFHMNVAVNRRVVGVTGRFAWP